MAFTNWNGFRIEDARPDPRLIQRVAFDPATLQMRIAERDLRMLDHRVKVGR